MEIWIDNREDYIKKLRGSTTATAGFTGKSKLARSVGHAIGNALSEAALEREGTNRMSGKPRFEVDQDSLRVFYKPPKARKETEETYRLASKEELIESLKGTEPTTELELATYDPHIYDAAEDDERDHSRHRS